MSALPESVQIDPMIFVFRGHLMTNLEKLAGSSLPLPITSIHLRSTSPQLAHGTDNWLMRLHTMRKASLHMFGTTPPPEV